MKQPLSQLTRRQKIALISLAAANVVALALAWIVLSRGAAATDAPVPAPDCGAIAAHLLAAQNLAGSANVGTDNVLHLYLTGLDVTGQALPRATDLAWDALAAMLGLPRVGCGPYTLVQVDIPAPEAVPFDPGGGGVRPNRMLVSVDWIELWAWGYGELDDGALAGRLQTTLYAQPSNLPNP